MIVIGKKTSNPNGIVSALLIRRGSLWLSQAVSWELMFIYFSMIFAAAVFTREPYAQRMYEMIPFWSWRKVLIDENVYLLRENLLNIAFFFSLGVFLQFGLQKSWSVGRFF